MNKKTVLVVIMILLVLPVFVISQPSPLGKLPYDIKNIDSQEVGDTLWVCYEVYDGAELMFYDCEPIDKSAKEDKIKALLESVTKDKHDMITKEFTKPINIGKNNIKCWEYSEKIGDWIYVC